MEDKKQLNIFDEVTLKVVPVDGDASQCQIFPQYGGRELLAFGITSYSFEISDKDGNQKDYFGDGETITLKLSEETIEKFNKSVYNSVYELIELSAEYTVSVER